MIELGLIAVRTAAVFGAVILLRRFDVDLLSEG
jgi:hypothetical protein